MKSYIIMGLANGALVSLLGFSVDIHPFKFLAIITCLLMIEYSIIWRIK